MNFAHLHLILTHFPPVLSLGGVISGAAAIFLPRRRPELVQLTLLLLIVVGASMPLVYFAGDRAADTIGRVEGINQDAIAPHQHAAKIALSVSTGAAFAAVILLIVERRHPSLTPILRLLVLVIALASAATIGWTANLGGEIHHPEIHHV